MNDPRQIRTPARTPPAQTGLRTLSLPGLFAVALFGFFPVSGGALPADLTPVLEGNGPWMDTPVAAGQRNYRLVLEYDAEPGTSALLSLHGWKRLLPTGKNQRAEFAVEDDDDSPFILRHWRPGRDRPDSTERPRPDDPNATADVRLTAGEGFHLHRAFTQPLRDLDHAEWWARADEKDTARGAALYRDHCLTCHGDSQSPSHFPGLTAWQARAADASVDPYDLWLALHRQDGHPRLSEVESYQVVRYLRDIILAPHHPQITTTPLSPETLASMPRGRVLARPNPPDPHTSAPWRRMDHGPFLFHPLRLTGHDGREILSVKHGLITRLNPGIGGVTSGRVWAIHDLAPFRFLGFARGGQFSDEAVIFDGSDAPGLTLVGTTFENAPPAPVADAKPVFRGLTVSNRRVSVLFALDGEEFRQNFPWEDAGPTAPQIEPLPAPPDLGAPDPIFTGLVAPAPGNPTTESDRLRAEPLPAPPTTEMPAASWLRFTALAAAPDGHLALATLNGEIWQVSPPASGKNLSRWQRFAGGLDAPHRLAYQNGVLEARCRNGTFRLLDENKDGFCERYESVPPANLPDQPVAALTEQLSRFAAPARTADNTWYFALPASDSSPGAGLVRRDARSPLPADDPTNPTAPPPIYAWLPGAQAVPPAGPLWLPGATKWGPGLQSGTLWPCRDTGLIYRLWSANPGDPAFPRVLWSLPLPPLETDLTGAALVGPSLYLCGLPLDDPAASPATLQESPAPGLWRITRQPGHLFHPVEFAADDQSITLRFNAPIDAAATAANRRLKITAWQPDQAPTPAPIPPRRVLLGRNTLRVVSDAVRPGAGCTLECGIADDSGRIHPFTIHFTLPAQLPPAILPAPKPQPLPSEQAPAIDPADQPSPDLPDFEWPDRLPELDDPVEEEPLPTR